jgi:hypothetical protein
MDADRSLSVRERLSSSIKLMRNTTEKPLQILPREKSRVFSVFLISLDLNGDKQIL